MKMEIILDKRRYVQGEKLTGRVKLSLQKPESVKGIKLRFSGKYKNKMDANKGNKEMIIFDNNVTLFGYGENVTVIPEGDHSYEFCYQLPPGLPSTFQWKRINVAYFIEARLGVSAPWKMDRKVKKPFLVEGTYDLNLDPVDPDPVNVFKERYLYHLFPSPCRSGPFGVRFEIPSRSYVVGECIPFKLTMQNFSKAKLSKCYMSLIQRIEQSCCYNSWTRKIQELAGPTLSSGEAKVWNSLFRIPFDAVPTDLGNVSRYPKELWIRYHIRVECSLNHAEGGKINIKVPITIGTVPLRTVHISRSRSAFNVPSSMTPSNHRTIGYSTFASVNPRARIRRRHQGCYCSDDYLERNGQSFPRNYPVMIGTSMSQFSCRDVLCTIRASNFSNTRPLFPLNFRNNGPYNRSHSPPPSYDDVIQADNSSSSHHIPSCPQSRSHSRLRCNFHRTPSIASIQEDSHIIAKDSSFTQSSIAISSSAS